jgi:hypothetical protein
MVTHEKIRAVLSLLILNFLFSAAALCQTSDLHRLIGQYEEQKKEKGLAVVCSTIFPGGGLFYAKQPIEGMIFSIVGIAEGTWLVHQIGNDSDLTSVLLFLSVTKTWEYVLAISAVEEYNSSLRQRLGLAFLITPEKGLTLRLEFRL